MITEKIKIRDKEYILKNTLRSELLFEQLAKKPLELSTQADLYTYFYSILLANNKEFNLPFITEDPEQDCFISVFDEDPELFSKFINFLNKVAEEKGMFHKNEVEEKEEDKNKKGGKPKKD